MSKLIDLLHVSYQFGEVCDAKFKNLDFMVVIFFFDFLQFYLLVLKIWLELKKWTKFCTFLSSLSKKISF